MNPTGNDTEPLMSSHLFDTLPKPTDLQTPSDAEAQAKTLAKQYKSFCVLGLGYVGLPTALLFALGDFTVTGVDISERVLANIRESRVPEVYPELGDWWREVQGKPGFRVENHPLPSDVFLITVPTPVHPVTKACDLTAVRSAMESILPVLMPGNLVVLESTVPPRTTRDVLKPMIEERTGLTVGKDVHLCFSPERVLPGNTTYELVNNHRVIGGVTPESALLAKAIFEQVMHGAIYTTDDITAEFCKLAENTYRDVNIALANELSVLADDYGLDIKEARTLINMHPRVNLLKPGIGVGGHCIAVDPWFFVEMSPDRTELIHTSRLVNDKMPEYTVGKILKALDGIENPRICLVGLSYKPDVGDTRESPAVHIVEILKERGYDVVTYDPLLEAYQHMTLYEAAKDADYLGVLVGHTSVLEELAANTDKIRSLMRTPLIHIF